MSQGLNRVILLGNLGADPELRAVGETHALNMRLATSETFLDRNKEKQERTEWHRVVVWGKRGEGLARFLKKGDRLLVEGAIRTSSYEKDGEKRYSTEIVASNIVLSGGGKGSNDSPPDDGDGFGGAPDDDDDIPF